MKNNKELTPHELSEQNKRLKEIGQLGKGSVIQFTNTLRNEIDGVNCCLALVLKVNKCSVRAVLYMLNNKGLEITAGFSNFIYVGEAEYIKQEGDPQ